MRKLQTIRATALRRHIHQRAYAALVLSGGYEEAGDQGRLRPQQGEVIFHDRFEAHQNRIAMAGAVVLNLRMPPGYSFDPGLGRVENADHIVHLAERDETEAAIALIRSAKMQAPRVEDWTDELALTLLENPSTGLSQWSGTREIAPWKTARGFARVFGATPSAFRARARARLAWKAICKSREPLADIAARLGFADQSHMTRSVKAATGLTPQAWRALQIDSRREEE